MRNVVRVLVVEDSAADAKLVVDALRQAGHEIESERVDCAAAMSSALAHGPWHVILCDWTLPGFNAPAALELLKATGLDIPFVIVSGTIGEATAVDAMRAGANDFLLKDHIARLAPAVERELRDAQVRADQRSAAALATATAIRAELERTTADALLRATVAELHRSNEALAEFAYFASHDLQEPLRMVASYTQLLARRYKGKLDADADEFIAFAVDGAERMQRLIRDLLTYSRVSTREIASLETSCERALEQALANLHTAIDESGAVVTHDQLPIVVADAAHLIQLFQNLVGNAIKYQQHGAPRVHISSVRSSSWWELTIKDNGMGIEPMYFERIFGMFQQLHGRDEFGGTGIGLAICKKIVERNGGTISVDSIVGEGSTFHFTLPASATELQ